MPSTTLITGGAGFIGSHLAHHLRAHSQRVLIIDDLSTGQLANIEPLIGEDCQFIEGSVSSVLREQPSLLDDVSLIYHLAASVGVQLVVSDPARIIRNNIDETAVIIDAARRVSASVLIASSSEVYGKSDALPLREDGDLLYGPTTGSRWSYAMSKAVDEHLALSYDAQMKQNNAQAGAVVVRLFNTIGPRQVGHYGMVVPRFVQAAVQGKPLTIYGDGLQTRSFCDVRDVVKAMTLLLENSANHGQIFNVGSDAEITIHALADRVIAMAQSTSSKEIISFDQAYRPGFEDPFRRRVPDVNKLKEATGWEAQWTLEATLKELIEDAQRGR